MSAEAASLQSPRALVERYPVEEMEPLPFVRQIPICPNVFWRRRSAFPSLL
jgi:hypothetical protein